MSITDAANTNLTGEVRIRAGSHFQQLPNLIEAAEDFANGQFVFLSTIDGKYSGASQNERATHCVIKSGEPRLLATEIATLSGIVQAGETVMAFTGGPGTVTIPFATDVSKGDELMINADGYAVVRPSGTAAFAIGTATEDVTIPVGMTTEWGEAFITLPAQWAPAS